MGLPEYAKKKAAGDQGEIWLRSGGDCGLCFGCRLRFDCGHRLVSTCPRGPGVDCEGELVRGELIHSATSETEAYRLRSRISRRRRSHRDMSAQAKVQRLCSL